MIHSTIPHKILLKVYAYIHPVSGNGFYTIHPHPVHFSLPLTLGKHEIGPVKKKKVRIVNFGNALAGISKQAGKQKLKIRMQYDEPYHRDFYREATKKIGYIMSITT